ncbi:hypothetical protein PVK06_012826 [Gossypium arboreum]|uniref:B box-type domain-containing protein n=1 Tax=Gossypium arboreum TaxID=29729 RepID=A0ABR0QDI3_GOSAR|nr:hypothetical protein PVK06_012826 [Gossypium arboreum]
MCKGLQQGSTSSSCLKRGVSLSPNANPRVSTRLVKCELCNSRATLYCQADDAYLCRKCDKWVHDANFLAQRHIRKLVFKQIIEHAESSATMEFLPFLIEQHNILVSKDEVPTTPYILSKSRRSYSPPIVSIIFPM